MGFSDIGCFGSEIRTPFLDAMAKHGARFSQMYNCARCCPTRASLLTGLYPHQAGVGHMIEDHCIGPAYQGYLRTDCVTIGEALRAGGYNTAYAGKWHASPGVPLLGDPPAEPGSEDNPIPLSRGFDRFFGTLAGGGNYFYPHCLFDQDRHVTADSDEFYYTDAITDRSREVISEWAGRDKPFFLHVCYTAPHWPLHARPEDIERYVGKYRKGWDHFRTARHEELKGLSILDSKWAISPRDRDSHDFFSVNAKRQEWEDLRMAVYAAQVESMDRGIGRILSTLRETGIEEDTLVMFLSDNGGCAEFLNEDGDDKTWPGMYGRTAPPGVKCTVGNIESISPGPVTSYMSYDLPWANVSNTPFRLFKHWVHEGGISTPFVIQWPAAIRKGGGINHRPCHVIDIMATCLDAAGVDYPAEFKGRPITPLEGESLLPLLNGAEPERSRPLFWEHEGNCAVRDGEWKAVRRNPGERRLYNMPPKWRPGEESSGEWELYNMCEDRTELRDLSVGDRTRLRAMVNQFDKWASKCGVLDWPPGRG